MCACILLNWERRAAISAEEKPAERRASNPRGLDGEDVDELEVIIGGCVEGGRIVWYSAASASVESLEVLEMAAWMYIGSTRSSFSFSSAPAAAAATKPGGGRVRFLCCESRRDEVKGKVGGSKAPADMSLIGQAARCGGRCGRMRVWRLFGVVMEGEEMVRERSGVGGAKRMMRCSAVRVMIVRGGEFQLSECLQGSTLSIKNSYRRAYST